MGYLAFRMSKGRLVGRSTEDITAQNLSDRMWCNHKMEQAHEKRVNFIPKSPTNQFERSNDYSYHNSIDNYESSDY